MPEPLASSSPPPAEPTFENGRHARVGVDVGGTFTDIVVEAGGSLTVWKVPTTSGDPSEGIARGIREALERAASGPPALVAHGTTVATNAVLERRGAATGLITTDGFRDVLLIGRQNRPSLYRLDAVRPPPVVPREWSIGVAERVAPGGEILEPLDEAAAAAAVERLSAEGVRSVAVCLLFSFANPAHEQRIGRLLAERAPGVRVSLSHQVLPEFREYERASTTALDAYIGPIVEGYVGRVAERIRDLAAPVVVMRSGGGTMGLDQAAREPVHTLLSGPAAGVRGAAVIAREAEVAEVVTFDMGGTSTDVCLIKDGRPAVSTASTIGGLPFSTPALAVHTVGAGGGSVLWADPAGALRVGPRSAGAQPGPACYGRGGAEPTVTDAHLLLGHLDPGSFLGGRMRLHSEAARTALGGLADTLGTAGAAGAAAAAGPATSPEAVALAGLAAVRAQMAAAIRVVTVERGRDPRRCTLAAFGGAGPMHATALAAELGIDRVLVPPGAGALSALGLLAAPLQADASLTRPMIDPDPHEWEGLFRALEEKAAATLRSQGAEPAGLQRIADCRYLGQAHEIPVGAADPAGLAERFEDEHLARYGWVAPGEPVEVVTLRVRATGPEPRVTLAALPRGSGAGPSGSRRVIEPDGGWAQIPAYRREALGAGDRIRGPALIDAAESTVVVEDGWEADVQSNGTLLVARR